MFLLILQMNRFSFYFIKLENRVCQKLCGLWSPVTFSSVWEFLGFPWTLQYLLGPPLDFLGVPRTFWIPRIFWGHQDLLGFQGPYGSPFGSP